MQKPLFKKQSLLCILTIVYLFFFLLVSFSLSVPPADFPLCVLLFVLAGAGLFLSLRESRVWRIFWIIALVLAVAFGVLEVVAGKLIAHERSACEPRPSPVVKLMS